MLYVVATPIGHLEDISQRALKVLADVDYIAAEDKRISARLLSSYSIDTPMLAYHDHSSAADIEKVMQKLRVGCSLALISDAGTPLISDPGFALVNLARKEGYSVSPIPGCSALTAALSASGLPCSRFVFEGFLPAKSGARQQFLESLVDEQRTLVFFEAPRRLLKSLADMQSSFGATRQITLAREISKRFETFKTASIEALVQWVAADSMQLKGECVLIVEGAPAKSVDQSLSAEVMATAKLLNAELPPKTAAKLCAQITGANKKEIYRALVELN